MAIDLLFRDLQGLGDDLVGYGPCGLVSDGCTCLRLVFAEPVEGRSSWLAALDFQQWWLQALCLVEAAAALCSRLVSPCMVTCLVW